MEWGVLETMCAFGRENGTENRNQSGFSGFQVLIVTAFYLYSNTYLFVTIICVIFGKKTNVCVCEEDRISCYICP